MFPPFVSLFGRTGNRDVGFEVRSRRTREMETANNLVDIEVRSVAVCEQQAEDLMRLWGLRLFRDLLILRGPDDLVLFSAEVCL